MAEEGAASLEALELRVLLAGENAEGKPRRIVKIAPGEGAKYWDDSLREGYVCVGWDEVGDLGRYANSKEVRAAFEAVGLHAGSKSMRSKKANEVWLLRELVPGDIVVANRGTREILAIGEVVTPYAWRPDRVEYRHTVGVRWDTSFATRIPAQPYWANVTLQELSPGKLMEIMEGGSKPVSGEDPPAPTLIEDALAGQGLRYPHELVAAYLLALRAKRFVILSGISGTGKTQLALAVARHFAGGERARRYTVVPVRPDWTDNRGLLGYYNPILRGYVATEFLRLLLRAEVEERAAHDEGREAEPFFIILDEMNLARVEHYFSDFLSAFESGETIELHDDAEVESGEKGDLAVPRRLRIPQNLFFTGTVNVDETTYMFSPKVLDRAFVMELDQVDLDALDGATEQGEGELRLVELPSPFTAPRRPGIEDWESLGSLLGGDLKRSLVELHEKLKKHRRHFGYRVAFEIARFVSLAKEHGDGTESSLWRALDLAILFKVLPKFHGTQQDLEEVLRDLFGFATGDGSGYEGWELKGNRVERVGVAARFPSTAAKLLRMHGALRRRGFASFVE